MSASDVELRLSCANRAAQLLVVDGAFRVVARGMERLETLVPPGIYSLKARVGDTVVERVEILRRTGQPHEFVLDAPRFETPVPFRVTRTLHESHELSLEQFTGHGLKIINLGGEAGFVIFVRDACAANRNLAGDRLKSYANNFNGFSLLSADGKVLVNFDSAADRDIGNGHMGCQVRLSAGAYVLAWERDGERICLPVNTVAGFTLQIYVGLQPVHEGALVMRPDFREVAYILDRMDQVFSPRRGEIEVLESVRLGLQNGRNVQAVAMRELLARKFENPLLGLYAGHLMLMYQPDKELFEVVIGNTMRMVGRDYPDVVALAWGYEKLTGRRPERFDRGPWAKVLDKLRGPPLLLKSWDLLLDCAQKSTNGRFARLDAFRIASDLVIGGIFVTWRLSVPDKGAQPSLPQRELFSRLPGLTYSIDLGRRAMGQLATMLPKPVLEVLGPNRIMAAAIRTPADTLEAVKTLANKYPWEEVVQRLKRADEAASHLTGLQRELILVMRQLGADKELLPSLDVKFVEALLQSNRVPLASLADALAGLDAEAARLAPANASGRTVRRGTAATTSS